MRDMLKNKQTMYYARFQKKSMRTDENGDETGDYINEYEIPVEFKANIAPNTGEVALLPFGMNLGYVNQIITSESLPIEEGTLIWWQEKPPDAILNGSEINDGSTADFYVKKVARSLTNTAYALTRYTKDTES